MFGTKPHQCCDGSTLVPEYCVLLCSQYSGTKHVEPSQHWYPNIACFNARSIRVPNMMSHHNIGTRILRALKHAIFGYQCCDGSSCLVPEYCEHKSTQYSGTNAVIAHHVWYPNTASIKARNIRVPIFIEYLKFGTRILRALKHAIFGYQYS